MKINNKLTIIIIFILTLLLVGCYPEDNSISFKEEMVLQVQSKQHPLSLIKSIGKIEVSEDMIKGNKLICGKVMIECDEIDTSSIGSYDVIYKTNDTENHIITKTIKVSDMIPPKITFKGLKNNLLELTKEEFNNYNFAENIVVSDNFDSSPETKVSVKERIKSSEYTILVESLDQFGNKSNDEFYVKIKEEKINKDETNSSKNNHPKKDTNKNNVQNTNKNENSQSPSKKYPRKSKTFYFGQTYELNGKNVVCNMENVTQICSSRMSGNSECIPLKDENGIYIGMKLNFK